ncbi:MAG: insulinase family protein [Bacteroidetes bacterium]|nr:insulinase family protein [Bacteroidota bacterium]MBS1972818.1 insulinase family protein [Bacteroidota bacterium]
MNKSLLIGLLATAQFIFAQPKKLTTNKTSSAPEFVTAVEGVKEYKLPNGLRILLVPDAAQTNVVVNVVYHVGSRNEGYGETGMAHLLEHMMFKGSKRFSSIKQTIADKGAFANGTTWYDRTDYYEVLPATDSNLTWALDMESDRMVNSLMKNEDLQKEFTVVRNEFEMGENNPDNILMERVISTMYLWHNYGKSTIGSKDDIESVPIGNLKMFYQKYYQPDNATLIVGGKFDEKKTLERITKYFGKIPKPSRIIQPSYTVEPPQDGQRYVELKRNGDISFIGIGYHTPAFSDKDYVANDAIINILTNDPSGYFYKTLVEPKLATKISGFSFQLRDPGFTYFSCNVPKDKSPDSAKNAFIAAADHLETYTVTQEDLDRAKNALIKQVTDMQNNTLNFCISLAEIIGAGDWRLFYIYRDRVEKLTLADVQAALKKYYLPSNRTIGIFIPDKSPERTVVGATPDIDALVKNYTGKATKLSNATFEASISNIKKNTQYGTLANGMRYALLKKPTKGDKIYANIVLKIGSEKSLTGKNIIPGLTARMLKNGTATKSKKEINDLLDKIKTNINIYGSGATIGINLASDKDNINAALDLLADILLHPSFNKDEFDKMLLDMKGELENSKSDPQYVASNTLNKKISPYPKGHPLHAEDIEETLLDLKAATLDDIKSFYKDFYGANNGYAAFVGNIDGVSIQSFLEKSFGSFNSKEPYSEIEEKYFDVDGGTQTIEIKDKTNAVCMGAINVPLKQSDPDFIALDIANEMLGGGAFLSSRIPQRLRESEGMSYGAGSFLSFNYKYPSAIWGAYAIFNPVYKNRLDSALHDVIDKTLQNGFKEDEMKKCLSSWLQQRKTELGFDQSLSSRLASYMSQGKDLEFFSEYEEAAKKLTLDQVNAALRKYISNGKFTLIYAGDFSKK